MTAKINFISLGLSMFARKFSGTLLWLTCLVMISGCQEDTIEPKLFGNIFGEILEENDNLPIAQVTVSTNPPTSSVFSDSSGRFVLDNIPEGTYSLRAEKSGFLTEVASVTVFGDQDANVIIRMENDSSENTSPSVPQLIAPSAGATNQDINTRLVWSVLDQDEDDLLSYEIILFNFDMSQSNTVASNLTDTAFVLSDLAYNTTYFWQVIVSDGVNPPVFSPVLGFKTIPFPDHRFLFTRSVNGKYEIFSADGLGSEIQLTQNSGSNWRPRINPQRNKIAFISNENIQPQIYVMDRDGKNLQRVTSVPISGANQLELDFAWSPDGTKILYMANNSLLSVNVDGSGLSTVTRALQGFTFAECDWTPQGDFIVCRMVGATTYNSFIALYDRQGTFLRFIVTDTPGATGGPKFSIAGTEIIYTHDVSGFESQDERQLDSRIFLRSVQSSVVTDISIEKDNGTNDFDPIYSPDGSKVIFTNTNNDGISRKDIYIMDINGRNRELLFSNAEMPEWK